VKVKCDECERHDEFTSIKRTLEVEGQLCSELAVPLEEASKTIFAQTIEIDEYHNNFEQKVNESFQRIVDSANSRRMKLLSASKQGRERSVN